MIYCLWYPSGGFGHFVNAVLTLHGKNFVRPVGSLEFSPTGDSHSLDLVVPKYQHECWPGGIEFLDNKNYSVLIDNGINNKSTVFKSKFPNSTIVKICYSNDSWPVVARTMIEKAMASSIEKELLVNEWSTDDLWARREKYFLYLRDHELRYAWHPANESGLDNNKIYVSDLYEDYDRCYAALNAIAVVEDFRDLWKKWRLANTKYIDPVITAHNVLTWVINKQSKDLSNITDIWTQAVIYYYIWLRFQIEVPHNDFANFFRNTDQVRELVS